MKNAHERFGRLVYRRHSEKTATNLRVFLDAFVGEERGKAHLVSVLAVMLRSAPWPQRSPTGTHSLWSILTAKKASSP